LEPGNILVYQTNEGRYGKMEIQQYGYNLMFKWVTYNSNGSVYSSGQDLTIQGTWHCDLDLGVQSPSGGDQNSDFWWEQVGGPERYLAPQNGALFNIYTCLNIHFASVSFDDFSSCDPESENPFEISSCVTDMGDGIYTATFYWTNTSGAEITMTSGLENHVNAPGNTQTGNVVPMTFIPGSGSFDYSFDCDYAEWKINYPYSPGTPQVNEISTKAEPYVSPMCLPDPALALEYVETSATHGFTIYHLDVTNWIFYPYELFYSAPQLPPCVGSSHSSRSWVDIYADGLPIKVYCDLALPEDLDHMSVSVLSSETPTEIYIILIDRELGITYTSNVLNLGSMKLGLNSSIDDDLIPDQNIRVYPNPTGGKITIDFGQDPEFRQLSVLDFLGRVQKFEKVWIPNRGLELDLSNLSSGIYFVKLELEDQFKVFQVIKK